MKKSYKFLFLATVFASFLTSCSDNSSSADELEDTFDASVVCPVDGLNAFGEPNRGTFTDERDGQVYKYTTIGNQVWMAENLKFDAPYSLCYDKIDGFCDTFGRFYSLHINGEYFDLFDQDLLDTICPAGWHVPSVDEWNVLIENMGGGINAVSRLYSKLDFGNQYKNGSDDCMFNSIPAGNWNKDSTLAGNNVVSIYWTSTVKSFQTSYNCFFGYDGVTFGVNYPKMTIRCVRN